MSLVPSIANLKIPFACKEPCVVMQGLVVVVVAAVVVVIAGVVCIEFRTEVQEGFDDKTPYLQVGGPGQTSAQ